MFATMFHIADITQMSAFARMESSTIQQVSEDLLVGYFTHECRALKLNAVKFPFYPDGTGQHLFFNNEILV